jgi:hypothetical protein
MVEALGPQQCKELTPLLDDFSEKERTTQAVKITPPH